MSSYGISQVTSGAMSYECSVSAIPSVQVNSGFSANLVRKLIPFTLFTLGLAAYTIPLDPDVEDNEIRTPSQLGHASRRRLVIPELRSQSTLQTKNIVLSMSSGHIAPRLSNGAERSIGALHQCSGTTITTIFVKISKRSQSVSNTQQHCNASLERRCAITNAMTPSNPHREHQGVPLRG